MEVCENKGNTEELRLVVDRKLNINSQYISKRPQSGSSIQKDTFGS